MNLTAKALLACTCMTLSFVHANGQYIELPALGRDIRGQALAQDIFFQHHPGRAGFVRQG